MKEFSDNQPIGTMSSTDLWAEKNTTKFIGNCDFLKDKVALMKITKMKSRSRIQREVKPFLLSRKEELNLMHKVYLN